MHTYVIYDIVKGRIRKKIADVCLDYGLKRIQYSAFLGTSTPTRRRALGGETHGTTWQSGREDRDPQRVREGTSTNEALSRRQENEHTCQ